MSGMPVNVGNFARAETDRMFAAIQAETGGVSRWFHYRAPTPVDQHTLIRMNRDTLYSEPMVDICRRPGRPHSRAGRTAGAAAFRPAAATAHGGLRNEGQLT